MRKIVRAASCAAAALGCLAILSATPSQAREFPVCSYGSGGGIGSGGGFTRCEFETYDQCRATTSGVGGYCMDNPAFGARAQQWDGAGDQPRRPSRRQRAR